MMTLCTGLRLVMMTWLMRWRPHVETSVEDGESDKIWMFLPSTTPGGLTQHQHADCVDQRHLQSDKWTTTVSLDHLHAGTLQIVLSRNINWNLWNNYAGTIWHVFLIVSVNHCTDHMTNVITHVLIMGVIFNIWFDKIKFVKLFVMNSLSFHINSWRIYKYCLWQHYWVWFSNNQLWVDQEGWGSQLSCWWGQTGV